jgi:hypothetical protein
MIPPIGQSPGTLYSSQAQARPKFSTIPQEAFAIDLDKLFTPAAERKTIENIKEHAKAQGKDDREIEMLEGEIIAAKHAEKSISHDISIKENL